jgi:hypothetical protein
MMPTKTSVGPNEVVRLEVLRLTPPLQEATSKNARSNFNFNFKLQATRCGGRVFGRGDATNGHQAAMT